MGEPGCESFKFIFGRDDTALSPDIGMYIHFDVNESNGYPYGCPGLEHFKPEHIVNGGLDSGRRSRFSEANCEKQMYKDEDDVPMYEIVEEFADDQAAWVDAFIPTMEKMMWNGYDGLE